MNFLHKTTLLLIATVMFTGCFAGNRVATGTMEQDPPAHASIDVFYQSLRPYGRWMSYGSYGTVWVPDVSRNFRPYATNGHWVYSGYGWTWVSGYKWGWGPFHYGRWTFDNRYGWIWIPGHTWAPAWVAWRRSSGFYGWAPLGPGMNISVNINIAPRYWTFVPGRYITRRRLHKYYLPYNRNITIINNTTIINNVYEQNNQHYFSGPTRRAVQQRTNTRITPVRVANGTKASRSRVSANNVRMYRPTISRDSRENTNKRHQAKAVRTSRTTERQKQRRENTEVRKKRSSRKETPSRTRRRQPTKRSSSSRSRTSTRRTKARRSTPTRSSKRSSGSRSGVKTRDRKSRPTKSSTPARNTNSHSNASNRRAGRR